MPIEVRKMFLRPYRSPSFPQIGVETVTPSTYAVTTPDPSPADELRTAMALFALHTAWLGVMRHDLSDDERRAVALGVAYELVERRDGPEASGAPEPAAPVAAR
jgi:hypothetical protein